MPASFQLFTDIDQFTDDQGSPLVGGSLRFYEAETTTPKDVFGDQGLTVNNGPELTLDSAGRTGVEVWGSGAYFVELYNALNVKIAEADNVEIPGGEATALPALQAGEFLTNDGSVMSWEPVRQVPDPTGSNGKILSTDGSNLIWISNETPDPPDPEIVVNETDGYFQAGVSTDPTKFVIQKGTASAPSSGGVTTQTSVVYDTPFATNPVVMICNRNGTTAAGYYLDWSLIAESTTGFTVAFNGDHAGPSGSGNIVNPVPFGWVALGEREIAP